MSAILYALASLIGGQAADQTAADINPASVQMIGALTRFGECVAKHRETSVRQLLATDIETPAESGALMEAARTDTDCDLSGLASVRVNRTVLTGAILEAYYHRKLGDRPLPSTKSEGWMTVAAEPGDLPAIVLSKQLLNLGTCVAAKSPAWSANLLATKAATYGEQVAVQALRAEVNLCAKAAGLTSLTRLEIRSGIAVGLVNMVTARNLAQNMLVGY